MPDLFSGVHIHRSQVDNAAVWNLQGRPLQERNGRPFIGDQPLRYFHFHLARPGTDPVRYFWQPDPGPAALRILADYIQALEAKGYREHTDHADYRPHDMLPTFARIPPVAFRAMRDVIDSSPPAAVTSGARPAESIAKAVTREEPGRSRFRVLAYHRGRMAEHRRQIAEPNDIHRTAERYRRSAWFRLRVDWWYYWRALAH